ncbi:hypothetical protein QO002_005594 [Pararhizobium capsulatum DSM 1112]|uniref:Uncharacterized protein n=1 Tax=Pararhizobium capsulatum DSM 1112 TaxID=1121113 RepID=A0ABU0BYP7_9HYPH|nr:hypothetical protein [Pararhizobium capsulatum DSM 1112]
MSKISKYAHDLLSDVHKEVKQRISPKFNIAKSMGMVALVVAVSSCTTTPTKIATKESHYIAVGYPNPVKQKVSTTKMVNGTKVVSQTAITVTYLGRAPYICTPSGFGRKSSCFARPFTTAHK